MLDTWKQRARQLKTELIALTIAYRDPRTPWVARLVAALVVGYAFSPIDLIPDPIPVLGYLDDLILLPIGIALALRLIPPDVMADARAEARTRANTDRPVNWVAGVIIAAIWVLLAVAAIRLVAGVI